MDHLAWLLPLLADFFLKGRQNWRGDKGVSIEVYGAWGGSDGRLGGPGVAVKEV